ncbi:MAG: acyl-CoA dehydrogenase family protein [Chloroflexi bacterium]|nr:acyl-CoA dehydrogenase family protein [Chloroflexota bacterium]
MDFHFTPEQDAFRTEVRTFLEGEITQGSFTPVCDAWLTIFDRAFSKKVAAKGWIGMTWPKEQGGQGRNYIDRLIYTEEMLRYGAPVAAHWFADRQIGPSFLTYGTQEQKKQFLPRIIRGELVFALGMSEPQSGSDLASLKTRATEDGDSYVINGQKVWTSGAHMADYCYLVARTDPDAPKHKGISEFVIDMKAPGITVRPLVDMTDEHHFNEVFFENVRVPKTSLIGEKNRGWYQIAAQLDYERSGAERLMSNYPVLEALTTLFQSKKGNASASHVIMRNRIAQAHIEFQVGRLMVYRVASELSKGKVPNYEATVAKMFCTEFEQRLAGLATQAAGLASQLLPESKDSFARGMVAKAYLFSPGYTIQGGTSEILRNIIAGRGLSLPS